VYDGIRDLKIKDFIMYVPLRTNDMKNSLPARKTKIYFILLLSLLSFLAPNAVTGQDTIVEVLIPASGFEMDADLYANTLSGDGGDWFANPVTGGDSIFDSYGRSIDSLTSQIVDDPWNSALDLTFTGSKLNHDPNDWKWVESEANPGKNDIGKVYFHYAKDNADEQWIFIAGDRLDVTGTSYFDFEFNQVPIIRNTDGTFSSNGNDGGRTENDFLVSMAYTNGGTSAVVTYYVWQLVGTDFNWVNVTYDPADVIAISNSDTVYLPDDSKAFGRNFYEPYQFVEAAINITGLLTEVIADKCVGINVQSIVGKTKTSASITANLTDFAEPIPMDLNLGKASIVYNNGDPICSNNIGTFPKVFVEGSTYDPNSLVFSIALMSLLIVLILPSTVT